MPFLSISDTLLPYSCLRVMSNLFSVLSLYIMLPSGFSAQKYSPVIFRSFLGPFKGLSNTWNEINGSSSVFVCWNFDSL